MPTIKRNIRRPFEPKKTISEPFARLNPNTEFYNSRKWRKFRKAFMSKPENQLCVECKRKGVLTPATVADHIIPINQGGARFDVINLQPLCASCHNIKSAKEGNNHGNR